MLVMKGLPLTYSKDMQEDKQMTVIRCEPITCRLAIAATHGHGEGPMSANVPAAMAAQAAVQGFSTATDLADWLVRVLGMAVPRCAHHVTGAPGGSWPRAKGNMELAELTLEDMQSD